MFKRVLIVLGVIVAALAVVGLKQTTEVSPDGSRIILVSIIDNFPRRTIDQEFELRLAARSVIPYLKKHAIGVSQLLSGTDLRNRFGSVGAGLDHSLSPQGTHRVLIVQWNNFANSTPGEVAMMDFEQSPNSKPFFRWGRSWPFSKAGEETAIATEGLLSEYAALFKVRYASQPQTFPAH